MLSEEQREVIVKAIDAVGWRPTTEEGQQYIDELRDSLRGMLVASAAPAEGREPTDAEILALNEGEVYFSETPTRFPEAGHGTQYHCGAPGLLKFARAVRALGKSKPAEGRLTERQTTEIFHAAKNAETYRDFMRVLPDIIADAREAVDERALSEIAVYLKDEADHAEYVSQNNNDGDVPTEQAKAIATLRDWARAVMKARAALATAPTKDADDFDANAGSTGGKEADRIINRLMSSDPDFDDCADTADLIARLEDAESNALDLGHATDDSILLCEAHIALTRLSQRVAELESKLQTKALEYVSLFDQCSEAEKRARAAESRLAERESAEPVSLTYSERKLIGRINDDAKSYVTWEDRQNIIRLVERLSNPPAAASITLVDEPQPDGSRIVRAMQGGEEVARMCLPAAAASELTDGDVFTLLGHAELLRGQGQNDMPAWFLALAERIAQSIGQSELAERCTAIASQKEQKK